MRLRITGITVEIAGRGIVDGIDLVAEPGALVGLVGPNGSGKSTVLRTVYRSLRPSAGVVWVGDDEVWKLPAREAARRTAAVTQDAPLEFDVLVRELVAIGRAPHKGPFDRDTAADAVIVEQSLARTGTGALRERRFRTLSGGEKQRVMIARALAQQSSVLVLDEPTNHLDVRYQLQVLELVRGLEITVVAALHDLNLAATYCDHLVVLSGGRVHAAGRPDDVLSATLIAEVFGVQAERHRDPESGRLRLWFQPLPEPQSVAAS